MPAVGSCWLEGLFAAKHEGSLVQAVSPMWGGKNESVSQPDPLLLYLRMLE